ncbi:hypothetical protein [Demequina aestuarii]|uniref:hypothetical protein n=1 Tax=Demequina aestuarii TaxID=327095 RepID=UPI0007818A07|nr:hypothetical protein [Demequina aestuarii]
MSGRWSLSVWVPGVIVALYLVIMADVTVWRAMIFLGLWVIAGAAARILVEYIRVRRRARDLTEG